METSINKHSGVYILWHPYAEDFDTCGLVFNILGIHEFSFSADRVLVTDFVQVFYASLLINFLIKICAVVAPEPGELIQMSSNINEVPMKTNNYNSGEERCPTRYCNGL